MKPSSAAVNIGPWIKGIQNLYDPAMTPKGCVVEADNVLIESDGSVTPRAGYAPVTTNVHSLFKHNGIAYGLYNGLVCELFTSTARPLSNIVVDGKVTWGVLNDEPVFTNTSILARISGKQVKLLGVEMPVPATPSVASPTLPLQAPTSEYAISFVNEDGEEGPLSPLGSAFLPPTEATVWPRTSSTRSSSKAPRPSRRRIYPAAVGSAWRCRVRSHAHWAATCA